ncbi:ATP-binding protein [Altererythrobacter sp. Root672]|uniref:ATP-binding protein n=1 Tax=Altererythrobacter sp. Root672 TaxID=1736584 RepID=UPI0006F22F19|nr:ATP-binding protein [Altererythrobacter sp. Root672]KRA84658.1 ATP-binding protein [Altererythrobacter sp. Root672]
MSASVEIGVAPDGRPVTIDIKELLATRLLVQGNSGSGKSHLLRRLLEESAAMVQQVVIDPEGDFVTLADQFGHVVVDGGAYTGAELTRLASRIRKHRASVVLTLDSLEVEAQMRCAALFLSALFDAPREDWFPALVIVDEAQMFAPSAAGDVTDEVRRLSLGAMTNLMCRGRKRGLAGIVATQRLAKLAKNVAAEASNFLMGRTFLDIDMARAADLLGMERRSAEEIRDLERGHFLGLGPAISRRPIAVKIGPVRTGSQAVSHAMAPPPSVSSEELHALLHEADAHTPAPPPTPPVPVVAAEELIGRIEEIAAIDEAPQRTSEPADAAAPDDSEQVISRILAEMASDKEAPFRNSAALFQDFSMRCRMQKIGVRGVGLTDFRRRFAFAVAGLGSPPAEEWADITRAAQDVPDDLLAPFLMLARAAQGNETCPEDEELGRVYGTTSPGRIRRLLEYLEKSGFIAVRTDFSGRRSVSLPQLGTATAPVD